MHTNYLSEQIFVTSVVPQIDHLSPVLFCLLINDTSDFIFHSKIVLLVDDAKIFKDTCCLDDVITDKFKKYVHMVSTKRYAFKFK